MEWRALHWILFQLYLACSESFPLPISQTQCVWLPCQVKVDSWPCDNKSSGSEIQASLSLSLGIHSHDCTSGWEEAVGAPGHQVPPMDRSSTVGKSKAVRAQGDQIGRTQWTDLHPMHPRALACVTPFVPQDHGKPLCPHITCIHSYLYAS